jgi:phospholipase D-like protein
MWVSVVAVSLTNKFRRRDHSGAAKAGWTVFVIFLPLIGVLTYMIARPAEDFSMTS